ncbi:TPA: O61 family O-antigen polymerase, partial [Escherichia coli]|nr:O61 family O-antigen polymerase [Escherichia coli]
DNFSLSYLIESISERIFLTQGMAMPAVIELAKSTDVTMMNSNDLKYTLFNFVYGYSPGSMPLFYTAELYVRYGWLMMSFISVIISLVFGFGAFVINKTKDSAIRWVYYISLYALIMGGVGSANLFFFIVAILWWLLLTLSNGTITSRSGK